MDTKYAADTKIANSRRQFEMQKANFDMEVNAKVRKYALVLCIKFVICLNCPLN